MAQVKISKKVGQILVQGSVVVIDPCYIGHRGKDLETILPDMYLKYALPVGGLYDAWVEYLDLGMMGVRVSTLSIILPEFDLSSVEHSQEVGMMGVDSGQAMILDANSIDSWIESRSVRTLEYKNASTRFNYEGACDATLGPDSAGILAVNRAVVSSTGFGDGYYAVDALMDPNAVQRVVGLQVVFLDEKEIEETEEMDMLED